MAKNTERRRTMVYSNVNKKKADRKSASNMNDDVIDLDKEVFIGLETTQKTNNTKTRKKKNKNKKQYKGNDDLKKLWESEKEELKKESAITYKKGQAKKNNTPNIKPKQNQSTKQNISSKPNLSPKQIALQEKIKRQKRKIIRNFALISILVIMLIGGVVYLLLSPVFNVKEIKVINNANISSQTIINLSGIQLNENMFKFSKREAKKSILSNPYIEEVQIKRKLFNSIEIDIEERNTTLMLEYGNSYVYINNQGYILEISTEKLNVPILIGYKTPLDQVKPGNRLNREDLERLKVVLNIMEVASSNGLDSLITKIDIKNKKDFILTLEAEDKIVYLGECSDLSTQMLFIKEMIEREKGIEGEFFIDKDLNTNKPVFREKV